MGKESKNDSRKKTDKTKKPIVFAKDKKQAVLAFVVLFALIANTIYMLVKYLKEQNPAPPVAQSAPAGDAQGIEQQQQQNLEGLTSNANPPLNPTVNPNGDSAINPTPTNPSNQDLQQDANNIYSQTVALPKNPSAPGVKTPQASENDVEILQKKTQAIKNGKMVVITVSSSGRTDPFLPSGDGGSTGIYSYLTPPPQTLPQNTDATKIISTTISGILYDKYSPSAIINIEGTDYLVKKGDIINKYKILSINKNLVAVQLGNNIYKAGVGELLTQSTFNDGNIANLNKKFGGNDVSINVRRKSY